MGGSGGANAHYVRDVSTVYLALGAAMLAAANRPTWRAPVLFVSALQYGIHTVNHLKDLEDADPPWVGPVDLATLAASGVLLTYLAWVANGART